MASHILSTLKPLPGIALALGGVIAVGAVIGGVWLAPQPASATPAYASQTGRACGSCHVSKSGGGALTSFGKAFAANGHKVPGKGGAKGKSSSAAPTGTTVVTTAAPAVGTLINRVPDVTGSPRAVDWVPQTNPGIVFSGPSPGPVLYGGGIWHPRSAGLP
jgi:hypothetical protein